MAAIDGLRGLLATVVVIDHAVLECGHEELGLAADVSVVAFFVMSGYALTRGWDGLFGRFLMRRFVRLWPVYALALGAGYLLAQRPPEPLEFFWVPLPRYDANEICPPAWSLFIEAWTALAMPAIVWSARGGLGRSVACIAACLATDIFWVPVNRGLRAFECYLVCFIVGAALSRKILRSTLLEAAPMQMLGRISYSLYLTHWLVLRLAARTMGPAGVVLCTPLAFLVAAAVYAHVERPSLMLSRSLGCVSVA